MELFKKIGISQSGEQIGSRRFKQTEPFTLDDVKEMHEFYEKNPMSIFNNVSLRYLIGDFVGTRMPNGGVIKDDNEGAPKVMFAMSKMTTPSGERIFQLELGKAPYIQLIRPYPILKSTMEDIKTCSAGIIDPDGDIVPESIKSNFDTVTLPLGLQSEVLVVELIYTDGSAVIITPDSDESEWSIPVNMTLVNGILKATAVGQYDIVVAVGVLEHTIKYIATVAEVVSNSITPLNASIEINEEVIVTAEATYTDGTKSQIAPADWALTAGLTKTATGVKGKTAGAQKVSVGTSELKMESNITVKVPTPLSVAFTPPAPITLEFGAKSVAVKANATMSDTTTKAIPTTAWTVPAGLSVATTGIITGNVAGTYDIVAKEGDKTATLKVTVKEKVVVKSIAFAPTSVSIETGESSTVVKATATMTDNSTIELTQGDTANTWVIPEQISLTAGVITSEVEGVYSLTVTREGITGTLPVTVTQATVEE